MFRLLSVIVFLAAFAVQTFNQAITMLDYYVNTTSYAKNCENKSRPVMKCKGKCQMMKKLQEEEQKQQQNPERKAEAKYEIASAFVHFAIVIQPTFFNTLIEYQELIVPATVTRAHTIFHPPASV